MMPVLQSATSDAWTITEDEKPSQRVENGFESVNRWFRIVRLRCVLPFV